MGRKAMVALWVLLGSAWTASAACTIQQGDGGITLENEHLRLVVVPSQGGKCASLVLKGRPTELTSWPNYGFLEDRRWGPQGYERLRDYPYQAKILKHGPDEVAVSLTSRCSDPGFSQLTVEKTLTLRDGEAGMRIDYRWQNGSRVALPVGWWFFHDLGLEGKRNTFYAPTPLGIERSVHVPGEGQTSDLLGRTSDRFLYDPPRGWSAVVSEAGVGAAATFDVRYTGFIYTFASQREATLEWAFNQVSIEPGNAFQTSFCLFPLVDLPTVDGAGEMLAGSLTTPGREGAWQKPAQFTAGEEVPVRVAIVGAKAETVQARVEARAWPEGNWQRIGEHELPLVPGKPAAVDLRYQPGWRATTVLRCVVSRGGAAVFDMERPIIYGDATGEYALRPTAEKIGTELATYRPKKQPEFPRQTTVTLPDDYQPSREVVTPHVRWARPWAGGKVRILAPMHHRVLRQLVELAQRADIDYETVAMDTTAKKMSSAEVHLLTTRLNAARYDVLVLTGSDWNRLAESLRNKVLAQVEQGKGLVLVGAGMKLPTARWVEAAFIQNGVLEALGSAQIKLIEYGKGRIAVTPYQANDKGGVFAPSPIYHSSYVKPICERYSREFNVAEYTYAMNARLVYWVAGRVPAIEIRMRDFMVAAGATGQMVAVEVTGAGPPVSGTLEMTVTDRWSNTVARVARPAKDVGAGRVVSLELPPLPAGPMVADAWLKRPDGAVVNWATKAFEVTGPVLFANIALDRDLYADGDTVRAALSLKTVPGSGGPVLLEWKLSDCFGRLLAEGQQPVAVNDGLSGAEIRVPVIRPLARWHFLHVQALRGHAPLAAARVGLAVEPLRGPAGLEFMAYGGFTERYREMFGCNTVFGSGQRGMLWTEQGCNLIAWQDIHPNFRVQAAGPEKVRPGCLSSAEFREGCKKNIEAYAKYARLQGNRGILIADEWGYGGEGNRDSNYCHSPSCLAGFRDFLAKEYGTLESLNRCWGTQYKDWAAIVPPSFAETQKSGRWERWTDHRRWVETLVADFFGFAVAEARRTHPEARMGFSGTPNAGSFNGYDWSKLSRTMNIICAYGGPQGEILRSLKGPGTFTARWAGYDRQSQNEKAHRSAPWFALLHDMDGLGYYISVAYAPLHYPDWTWTRKAQWIAEEWQDLRGGIAALVRNAARQADGIAIHYSQSSIHAATRDNRYEQYNNILSSLCQLLEDLGFQYNFVAYDAIERGELSGNCRVLFLPYSQAVSPKEARAIAAFVRGGGTVIADIAPALRDQHNKDAEHGLLDEVFGVRASAGEPPRFQLTSIAGPAVKGDVQLPAGCAKLQLDGGTAAARMPELGNAPAWITHRLGGGQGVLLNFSFAGYAGYRPGGTGGEIAVIEQAKQAVRLAVSDLARDVLARAGLRPAVRIACADGRPYLDAEIVRYRQGAALYVGILPSATPGGLVTESDTQPVTIDFGQDAHVYAVRERRYPGRVRQVSTRVTRSVAKVYALLPEELTPLEVELAGVPGRAHGARLVLRTKDQGADRVAHVTVCGPDGKDVWLYQRDVILRGGRGEWTVPLALNDPKGPWKIEARDAVSGQAAVVSFSLP